MSLSRMTDLGMSKITREIRMDQLKRKLVYGLNELRLHIPWHERRAMQSTEEESLGRELILQRTCWFKQPNSQFFATIQRRNVL